MILLPVGSGTVPVLFPSETEIMLDPSSAGIVTALWLAAICAGVLLFLRRSP
jgi:hypothetical protein